MTTYDIFPSTFFVLIIFGPYFNLHTSSLGNLCSSIVIAGSTRAHNVPHAQLPHALRPPPQTTQDRQSLEPSLASPGVPSSRVDPPSSQTLVYARRLQEDAQLGEGTRTSASPPLNVASAAPSAAAPVVSAKSIETSGLQVRSIRFVVIVCFFFGLRTRLDRLPFSLRCRPKCVSSGS